MGTYKIDLDTQQLEMGVEGLSSIVKYFDNLIHNANYFKLNTEEVALERQKVKSILQDFQDLLERQMTYIGEVGFEEALIMMAGFFQSAFIQEDMKAEFLELSPNAPDVLTIQFDKRIGERKRAASTIISGAITNVEKLMSNWGIVTYPETLFGSIR